MPQDPNPFRKYSREGGGQDPNPFAKYGSDELPGRLQPREPRPSLRDRAASAMAALRSAGSAVADRLPSRDAPEAPPARADLPRGPEGDLALDAPRAQPETAPRPDSAAQPQAAPRARPEPDPLHHIRTRLELDPSGVVPMPRAPDLEGPARRRMEAAEFASSAPVEEQVARQARREDLAAPARERARDQERDRELRQERERGPVVASSTAIPDEDREITRPAAATAISAQPGGLEVDQDDPDFMTALSGAMSAEHRAQVDQVRRQAGGREPRQAFRAPASIGRADHRSRQDLAASRHQEREQRELEEAAEAVRLGMPGVTEAARVARGFTRSPLAGAANRGARGILLRDREGMSAEEMLERLPGGRALEFAGEMAGVGTEIYGTGRTLAAAGRAMPQGRFASALQRFDPYAPKTLRQGVTTGVLEGLPTDVGYAAQAESVEEAVMGIGLGVGLGAVAGGALRRRMPRSADAAADAPAPREARAPEAEAPVPRAQEPEAPTSATPQEGGIARLRRRAADTLYPEGRKDALTQSGNRRSFQEARSAADADESLEWVSFDLNNFKAINDELGHDAGDQYLRDAAAAIRQAAEEAEIPVRDFRQGGDEFAALGPAGKMQGVADRARELLGPRQVGDVEASISGSVGPTFKAADDALQGVKEAAGGGRHRPRPQEPAGVPSPARTPEAPPEPARAPQPAGERPPWAARDVAPASAGRRQQTLFPGDGRKVETEYVVVEAGELRASHDPSTFARRPGEEFPPEIQGRAYHGSRGAQARESVQDVTRRFDEDLALDPTLDAGGGPPTVTGQGVAVAGNQRIMVAQRLRQHAPERAEAYRRALAERAEEFGIDPRTLEGMEAPVLVRRIVDPSVDPFDVQTLRRLNASSDTPRGKTKDALSDAGTRAEEFRAARSSLDHFTETIGDDDTIATYLETAAGREFGKRLVQDGVISQSERARYFDMKTGAPTDEGKTLVTRMFQSAAIGDPDVIGRAPARMLAKMDTALPAIIRSNSVPGWELDQVLREALDVGAKARADGLKIRDLADQVDFTQTLDPRVVEMAEFLDTAKKTEIRDAFRGFAEEAEAFRRQSQSDDLFGHQPRSAGDAAERFSGAREGEGVAALLPDNPPAVHGQALAAESFDKFFRGSSIREVVRRLGAERGVGDDLPRPGREEALPESVRVGADRRGRGGSREVHEGAPRSEERAQPLTPPRDTDLFGEPIARSGPDQGDLLPTSRGPTGTTAALDEARATVSSLEGKVARGAASQAEEFRFEEAMSFIRRQDGRGMNAEELRRRNRHLEQPQRTTARDQHSGDLFDAPDSPLLDGWKPPQKEKVSLLRPSERLPDAGTFRAGTAKAAPKPSEIVEEIARVFGLPIKEGKSGRGKLGKALGSFKPRSEIIRLSDRGDVATLGHELGHAIHKLLWGAPKARLSDDALKRLPGAIRGELEDLGKGISGGGLAEGWAEFWRRFIDNPEILPKRAPNVVKFARSELERHPAVMTVLEKVQQDWKLYREASPQARVHAKLSIGEDPKHFSIRDAWVRARTDVIDQFEPIVQAVRTLTDGKGTESIMDDAARMARLVKGSSGIVEFFFEKGALDFHTLKTVGKPLKEILGPVTKELDSFRDYIISRRAQELHRRKITTGLRAEDVDAVVKQLDTPEFRQAFDGLQEYNQGLLRYLRDAGVLSEESLEAITKNNQNYVPFYRLMDEKGGIGGAGTGFGHVFSPVKKIKGSGRDIIDPLESIMKNTHLYVQLAQKQQVSTALARLADQEGSGKFIEGLLKPVVPEKLKLGEIEARLEQLMGPDALKDLRARAAQEFEEATRGMTPEQIRTAGLKPHDPADELLMVWRPGDYFKKDNVISVLENGERRWFEVEPELYRAIEGLDKEQLDAWVRWTSAPARWLRAGATLAPEFMIRNPARDQMMAYVQSNYGYKVGVDLVKGTLELLRKGDAYWEWKASGASRAAIVSMDRRAMAKSVEELVKSGGVPNVVKNPMDALAALSELMENSTRLGEFMNARWAEGGSKEGILRAGLAAREISTDYGRVGAKTTALRHMTAFWNARLQGYDRLARAAKEDPQRFAAKAFSGITLPSLLEYYVNRDDPEYQEIPQWQKDLFWLMKVGDNWLRIPKPFELGLIFGTAPVRVIEWMDSKDPTAVDEFFRETLASEVTSFMPMPNAFAPLVENMVNYSFFMERPIVHRGMEQVEARHQSTARSSEVAQLIGRWAPGAGISPLKIDNLLYAWTGGLGRVAMQSVDLAVRTARGDDHGERPRRTPADVPGVRGVFARKPGFSSESVERLYREFDQAQTASATLRHFEREGKTEEYERALRDPEQRRLREREPRLRDVAAEVRDLRAQAERIERDPRMSAEEKRRRIDELGKRATARARQGIGRDLIEGREE